ncbi:MAG: cytochrome c biogenesis protein CcsA [Reichenbachiella sp.]
MKKNWWKVLSVVLLTYTLLAGMLWDVPRLHILNETIRNQYFHVCMWFGMILLLIGSMVHAIKYLSGQRIENDIRSDAYASIGILYGILGILTGMLWAKYAWGEWWSGDPKQNGAAIALLIYLAYFVLRGSFEDEQQRAKISAVYNIFAFFAMIPLLFILPRLTDSLHPGNGGNPGFNFYDMDGQLRIVFYPAIIGWTLLGAWMASIRIRLAEIKILKEA